MLKIRIIAVGSIKEKYLRDACAEYLKRLSAFGQTEVIELKESLLPDDPSDEQIKNALEAEKKSILAAIPNRAYTVTLCVEGKNISSEELADKLADVTQTSSCICFIIGSSYGLAPEVKKTADMQLSFSKMTFPHQLMRVILMEQIYRGFMINSGRKYHK